MGTPFRAKILVRMSTASLITIISADRADIRNTIVTGLSYLRRSGILGCKRCNFKTTVTLDLSNDLRTSVRLGNATSDPVIVRYTSGNSVTDVLAIR